MTFDEFQTHLLTFMWKNNDDVLVASLPTLILMADNELSRKLSIIERDVSVDVTFEDNIHTLPVGVRRINAVTTALNGPCLLGTATQMRASLVNNAAKEFGSDCLWYANSGSIMIAGVVSVSSPQVVTIDYREGLPDYAVTDTSWLADDFLDLYTYAVIKHCAAFLQQDERLAMWLGMYQDALNSALEDNAFNKEWGGSPLAMSNPRKAP